MKRRKPKHTTARMDPENISISLHPAVWRFMASCVESWAEMSRILDKAGMVKDSNEKLLGEDLARLYSSKIREAIGDPLTPKAGAR